MSRRVTAIRGGIDWHLNVDDDECDQIINAIELWANRNNWTPITGIMEGVVQISPKIDVDGRITGPLIDDAVFKEKLQTFCREKNYNLTVDDYDSAMKDYYNYLRDNPGDSAAAAAAEAAEEAARTGLPVVINQMVPNYMLDPISDNDPDDLDEQADDSLSGASPMSELIHTSSICLRL